MYLPRLLLLAVLSVTALGKKAQSSAYETYFKKQSSSTPVNLDERQFAELTTGQRDYHTAIVLTALDAKYACSICREFSPEWKILANSWQESDKQGNNRMLFGTLDFEKGRNVFISVRNIHKNVCQGMLTCSRCNCKPPLFCCFSLPRLARMRLRMANPSDSTF